MLAPPTSGDWTSKVDPTKLKNRKFNSGKGGGQGKEVAAIWTETPEQKRKRLQDEVMGVSSASGGSSGPKPQDNARDEETARRIREYNVSIDHSIPLC